MAQNLRHGVLSGEGSFGEIMERRAFLNISGLALGTMLLPAYGRAIAAEELLKPADTAFKKMLADT
eukprot:gene31091-38424_t